MSGLLNKLTQSALRHRALIRRLTPKSLHHLAGTVARSFIQATESADRQAQDRGDSQAELNLPAPLRPPGTWKKNFVVHVNDGLSSGGSERQIVNTLRGLTSKTSLTGKLLCWRLGETEDLGFYTRDLNEAGLAFANVSETLSDLSDSERTDLSGWLDASLSWIPEDVRSKILRLTNDLVRERPEIVHGWQDETALVTGFAGLLAGVPRIVVATRNVNPSGFGYYRPFMDEAYRALATRSEISFVNNSAVGARDYEAWAGLAPDRFQVLHNGMNVDSIDPVSDIERKAAQYLLGMTRVDVKHSDEDVASTGRSNVVGTIMRFNQEKRPLLWIQTAKRIAEQHPGTRFLMAGEGPMLTQARNECKRLGLEQIIFLPGAVRPVQIALEAMDVFLLTSQFEGLPNVTLEAGLAGLPIVTTDAGGARETILDGQTGLLIEQKNGDEHHLSQELADAVSAILADPAWPQRARTLAPEFVKDNFGMEHMLQQTLSLYGLEHIS